MHLDKTKIILLAVAAVLVIGGGIALFTYDDWKPLPDTTTYQGRNISFTYPRTYSVDEYGASAVYVSSTTAEGTELPVVEIVTYRNDPDVARPPTFRVFADRQIQALCGTDAPGETVRCITPVVEPYTAPGGYLGQQYNLTLERRNITSGAVSTTTYGPIYVFDITEPATPENPLRYEAIFVYPSFTAWNQGNGKPELLETIMNTLVLEGVPLAPTTTPATTTPAQ